MNDPESTFDPEILQARWVLHGIDAERLVEQAILALKKGYSGLALQQLARSYKPTHAEFETLPQKAFAEMGLKEITRDQAVSILIAKGIPPTCNTISELRLAFPGFMDHWRKHVEEWGGEPAGSFNDMAQFVHFVVEDLYEKGRLAETRQVFQLLEKLFVEGGEDEKGLIGYGFFETLQCVASWRPYGNRAFEEFLGTTSKQVWADLKEMWRGKNSLMEVMRAERKSQ
jgi:hypothetical protein